MARREGPFIVGENAWTEEQRVEVISQHKRMDVWEIWGYGIAPLDFDDEERYTEHLAAVFEEEITKAVQAIADRLPHLVIVAKES